jgi:hypothetical protein
VDDDVRGLVRVPEAAVRVAALLVVEDRFFGHVAFGFDLD